MFKGFRRCRVNGLEGLGFKGFRVQRGWVLKRLSSGFRVLRIWRKGADLESDALTVGFL